MIILTQNEFFAILLLVGVVWGICGYVLGNMD